MAHIINSSWEDGEKQCILVGQDSELKTNGYWSATTNPVPSRWEVSLLASMLHYQLPDYIKI